MHRSLVLRWVASFVLIVAVLASGSLRASADTSDEERAAELKLLRLINDARETKGLKPLREHADIRAEAEAHSERMANQQTLSHIGFDARTARIAAEDSGIDPDQICENVGSAGAAKMSRAMKGVLRAWKGSKEQADCLFDALGYRTRSGAVGVVFAERTWWVTFIAASDDTRR